MVKFEISITRRHLYVLAALVAAVALIVPTAGWAADKFKDVPDSNIFHDDIGWLADNGITLGCNPPANDEFCPGENVRRETMAAFMRRLAKNKVVDAKTAVTAQDADKLDGKDATDFLAANEAPVLTGDTMTVSSRVVNATETIEEVSVTTSSDGYLLITANSAWTGTLLGVILWLQLDNTTCDTANAGGIAFGYAQNSTGNLAASSSLAGTIAVSAGTHTITSCAALFNPGTHSLVGANVQALFIADGSVTTNLASTGDAGELFEGLSG